MLRQVKSEDAASLVDRAILRGLHERADFVHFELKQHYLLIRLRWGSRVRVLWRGTRGDVSDLMDYLKDAAGMDVSVYRAPQKGEFPFHRSQKIGLAAICEPYMTEEKVVLALPSLLWEAASPAA